MELEDKVLVLRRIHVTYTLAAPESAREVVERVHGAHARFCPVYRSITPSVAITTAYRLGGDGGGESGTSGGGT